MATSSGTRMAGSRGERLFEGEAGGDWLVCGDWVGSLAVDGVGVGDSDEDSSMTEGDENDCDMLGLDGTVPRGPAPV
jgi:hypothetical protein